MPAWDYDLIIIGGGPAGLTVGIYAGRARLKTLLLEKLIHGGQMMTTDLVENYPGFPEGITGFELSDRMRKQAEGLAWKSAAGSPGTETWEAGPHFVLEMVSSPPAPLLSPRGPVTGGWGSRGKIGSPAEGSASVPPATAPFLKTRSIAMVGGGDNALTEILFLARFAEKIHLIHRRDRLSGL